MKIWWSMPSDAWPWWFLNPHENLRNNIIDWYVFLGIHFTVSPEVLSVLVLEPWKGKIHLRTGNLLPPVSSAARNFGQIHFTSQTCPQGQKIRNSHDAVQTGKTPWINTCELCGKKRAEQQISKQENRTVTVGRCAFFVYKTGKKHMHMVQGPCALSESKGSEAKKMYVFQVYLGVTSPTNSGIMEKKDGPLCVSCHCADVSFSECFVFYGFCMWIFEYGVFVTNAFRTSVLWHVCELPTMGSVLFVFTPFMALLLLWWFLCERK